MRDILGINVTRIVWPNLKKLLIAPLTRRSKMAT